MDKPKVIKKDPSLTKSEPFENRRCPIKFFEEEKNGKNELLVKLDEDDKESILQAFSGIANNDLAGAIIFSATSALGRNMSNAEKHNIICQALADSVPRDAHEAKLIAQATVLYTKAMEYLKRAESVLFDEDTIAKDHWHMILMKSATNLLDLHTKTIDALIRYRQQGDRNSIFNAE